MDSDWPGLPRDLVDSILNRFVSVSDYLRFSVVCKAWHTAATENINNLLPPQRPTLIVPSDAQDIWNAYSVKDNELFAFQFQIPHTNRIIGSSNGWLVTMDEDFVVRLLNPSYSVPGKHTILDACITLPALTKCRQRQYDDVVMKAVLSANPTSNPDEYMVMILYSYGSDSAFIRPSRDKEWTYVNQGWLYFKDIIYYQDSFYAIVGRGAVYCFDVSLESWLPLIHNVEHRAHLMKPRLAESNTGELLLVERVTAEQPGDMRSRYTIGANIEKLYKSLKGWEWIEMKSIGDCALFIGENNCTLTVVASDFCGCQPNSIYFTNYVTSTQHQRDLGVYNMESRSYTTFYMAVDVGYVENSRWSPIWMFPSF